MLLKDMEGRIEEVVHEAQHDPEQAHVLEKKLWADALEVVSHCSSCTMCKRMAELSLSTREIKFPRWYA